MKGINNVYDLMRRPSQGHEVIAHPSSSAQNVQTPESLRQSEGPSSPVPPSLDNIEIDDEFNIPIMVAISILVKTPKFFII